MLVNKTNQLIEEVNELKHSCMTMIGSEMFESMGEQEFEMFKNVFNLTNTSMKVIKEQAEIIESIDKKLDKLLAREEL